MNVAAELGRKHGEQIAAVIVGGVGPVEEQASVLLLVLTWRIREAVKSCSASQMDQYLDTLKVAITDKLNAHGPIRGGAELAKMLRAVEASCRPRTFH